MGRIRELPSGERPRERLMTQGPEALGAAELLGILLRTGLPGKSAIELAAEILGSREGLGGLARITPQTLQKEFKGLGMAKACQVAAAIELGRRVGVAEVAGGMMDTPAKVEELMGPELRKNETAVQPQEILREALGAEAVYSLVVVHNHPSGDPAPSPADLEFTRKLRDGAKAVGVLLQDHVIIGVAREGRSGYYSFKEAGYL
ncbi:MAG: JAB domain-containing protein [Verrucomicrobia bacterium]|nr:JAB domain-containing protein [Verrucomicrobiota bacterium]